MLYLLYGKWLYLIKEEIETIKNELKIDSCNISTYNMDNVDIKDIIEDASTFSLFASKKLIICYNAYLFSSKKSNATDQEILEQYLNNKNEDTIIIFILNEDSIDERKKMVKSIRKNGTVKEFNNISNLSEIVKKMFGSYTIAKEDIAYLINRLDNNLDIIKLEVDKLKMYKKDEKEVTKEDIDKATTKIINTNIFNLIDDIIYKRKEQALVAYQTIVNNNNGDNQAVLVLLSNQFRLMYQARYLNRKGYSQTDMTSILGVHPYALKKALEKTERYNSNDIINIIKKLAKIDLDAKKGMLDINNGIELFILNL